MLSLFDSEAVHDAVNEQHIVKAENSNSTFTLSLSDQPYSNTIEKHSYHLSYFISSDFISSQLN